MSGLLSSVVGTCAGSYRNLMGRAVKVGAPAGGLVGMMADLGAPVADLSLYFVCGSGFITLLAGFIWFGKRQRALRLALKDGKITQEEMAKATESNGWSVTFAFGLVATIILGLVFVVQALMPKKEDDGPDRGILATLMPPLQKMQDSLFHIQKQVDKIETVTVETKEQTGRIESKMDDMSRLFEEALKHGGMIPDPKSAAAYYHNARQAELKADAAAARKNYNAFIATGEDFIDPCLAYLDMLKIAEGMEGAREMVTAQVKTNATLSLKAAAALLQPREARIAALTGLLETAPEYAPAAWLLSREYSREKLGEQTTGDKRKEKQALDQFKALDAKGGFQKFVMDKREVIKWRQDADSRLAALASISDAMLETPVTLALNWTNDGWQVGLIFADNEVKSIDYRLDGTGDFRNTGLIGRNTRTGHPQPNTTVMAGMLTPGAHFIEVRFTDLADKVNGPYKLPFNTISSALQTTKLIVNQLAASWVSLTDHDGKVLVYFSNLLPYRGSLNAIRYSVDSDALDKTFPFTPPAPGKNPNEIGDLTIYIEAPAKTKSVCVQVEFSDGTKSEKRSFLKP